MIITAGHDSKKRLVPILA